MTNKAVNTILDMQRKFGETVLGENYHGTISTKMAEELIEELKNLSPSIRDMRKMDGFLFGDYEGFGDHHGTDRKLLGTIFVVCDTKDEAKNRIIRYLRAYGGSHNAPEWKDRTWEMSNAIVANWYLCTATIFYPVGYLPMDGNDLCSNPFDDDFPGGGVVVMGGLETYADVGNDLIDAYNRSVKAPRLHGHDHVVLEIIPCGQEGPVLFHDCQIPNWMGEAGGFLVLKY